jgi:hypothetical protein
LFLRLLARRNDRRHNQQGQCDKSEYGFGEAVTKPESMHVPKPMTICCCWRDWDNSNDSCSGGRNDRAFNSDHGSLLKD